MVQLVLFYYVLLLKRLHVYQSTPEKWTTTEFLSTDFSELLHTTEFSSTSVFSTTPEIWSTPEVLSTNEFMSTEYIYIPKPNLTQPNLT